MSAHTEACTAYESKRLSLYARYACRIWYCTVLYADVEGFVCAARLLVFFALPTNPLSTALPIRLGANYCSLREYLLAGVGGANIRRP